MADLDFEQMAPKPDRKKLFMIILSVIIFLGILIGGAIGAWYVLSTEDALMDGEEGAASQIVLPIQYHRLQPPFVVSYLTSQGQRFYQVGLDVVTRSPDVIDMLKKHEPMVRSEILRIISEQQYNHVRTEEGRMMLQEQLLARLNQLAGSQGKQPVIEAVIYNNLVMQ